MKHTEQQNFISGVTTGIDYGDDESEIVNSANGDSSSNQADADTTNEAVVTEPTNKNDAEQHDAVEKILEKVIDRLSENFREAEERGFKRALDMARTNPSALGIDNSVPNFLADVRPDMWDN